MTPVDLIPFGVTALIVYIGFRLFERGANRTYSQLGGLGLAVWYLAVLIGAVMGTMAQGMYP